MEESKLQNVESGLASGQEFEDLDTTKNSILYRIFHGTRRSREPLSLSVGITIYFSLLMVTLLPLSLTAYFDLQTLSAPSQNLKLPFLSDWNVFFMFIVSLPWLAIYSVTDHFTLTSGVIKIVRGKILLISAVEAKALIKSWNARFTNRNLAGQVLGVVIGLLVACANYAVYSDPRVGYWILKDTQWSLTGWVYLYCIFLFYWIVTVYLLRIFMMSTFLRDAVERAQIRVVPFHPDRCGGLRPVGTFGLRHQYLLSVLGINLLILVFVYPLYLTINPKLSALILVAAIAFIVFGPAVLFNALLPFHRGMMRYKAKLSEDVAHELQHELDNIRDKLKLGPVLKEDEESFERLRKIANVVEDLPDWPFDKRMLGKLLTAYLGPVTTLITLLGKFSWVLAILDKFTK